MVTSPSYDVLNHTNHIFSESLSSGDDNDRDEYLQKDKDTHTQTKTNTKCFQDPIYAIYQKQVVQGFRILYWLSSCDDKDKDKILCIIRAEYFSGLNILQE